LAKFKRITDAAGRGGVRSDRASSQKKSQILATASEMMLNQGYERTAVAEIAKTAGVSLATFYKHFPTKIELRKS